MDNFTFDEKKHLYTLDGKPLTGVTTILGVLNKPALIQWAANEAVKYVRANVSYKRMKLLRKGYVVIKEKVLDEAATAHRRKKEEAAQKGTDTHALVENWVNACVENYGGEPLAPYTENAILPFVLWAQREHITFLSAEKRMYSRVLWVGGTADLIFKKDGKTYVGDIKTYKKIWDRVPFFQCAGYALMLKEMEGTEPSGYCIINLPKERTFNELEDIRWSFDIEGDTRAFTSCVELYRQLANF